MGFLGYPWGMLGASQYSVIPIIQISSLTGVWGVTFLIVLCNSVIAWYGGGFPGARGPTECGTGRGPGCACLRSPSVGRDGTPSRSRQVYGGRKNGAACADPAG